MTDIEGSAPRTDLGPLIKIVRLSHSPERAFDLFFTRMAQWWPLRTHSVGGERATSVDVEQCVDGRIVETLADGSTADWGTIIEWDPPHLARFTWHPGTPVEEATEVTVTFTGTTDGGTELRLEHSGWGARPDGAPMRRQYDGGWDHVLSLLVGAVETG